MRRRRSRLDRRPPLYALVAAEGSRQARQRRGGRRWLAVSGLALLLVVAVGAVVAAATGAPGGGPKTVLAGPPARPVAKPRLVAAPPAKPRPRPVHESSVLHVLRYAQFVAAGIPRERLIALTFDDGPSPYTQEFVSILTRMHAPATFFVVGQQLRYFAAGLADELRHGFEIGDHTENHAWLIRLGQAGQEAQIVDAARQLTRLGAPFPHLFRPPYGAFDATTLATLGRLGMLMVLWSVDPGDWRRPGTAAIVRGVLSAARPGTIVELHDGGGNRSETAAALPAIIDGLRARGYRLVTVDQLLAHDPPPPHQALPHLASA